MKGMKSKHDWNLLELSSLSRTYWNLAVRFIIWVINIKRKEGNTLGKKFRSKLFSHKGFHQAFKDQRQILLQRSQLNKEETTKVPTYMSWQAEGLECALWNKEYKGAGYRI